MTCGRPFGTQSGPRALQVPFLLNFGDASGSLGASFFHQDCALDPYFSMSVFGMVPGSVLNGFDMLPACSGT